MSIGAIITTPQGLAVVVSVLPTTFNVGSQTLSQVVAAPLGGGPQAPTPTTPTLPGGFVSTIQNQADFVAAVLQAQIPTVDAGAIGGATGDDATTLGSLGATDTGGASSSGIPGGISFPPTAYASAARAYQSTAGRSSQDGPQIVLVG